MRQTRHGTIGKLITDRGYGFIRTPQGDTFFHYSALVGDVSFADLHEGMAVTFELNPVADGKRPQANRVEVAESAVRSDR